MAARVAAASLAATLAALLPSLAEALSLPPEQIRLTFGDTPDVMTVSWSTSNVSTPSDYLPCVRWGISEPLLRAACGSSTQYTAFGVRSPALHVVAMNTLRSDTPYIYHVGDSRFGESAEYSFRSLPAPPASPWPAGGRPFTVAVTGDIGIVDSAATIDTITRLAAAGELNVWAHNGDTGYADNRQSTDGGTHADDVLNEMYTMLSNFTTSLPGVWSVGNHELQLGDVPSCGGTGPDGQCRGLAYAQRVGRSLPTASSGGSTFYYAVSTGPVRWISLSFESPWSAGSPQHAWAAAQIASVDRAATPWVAVLIHRPLYSSNNLTWPSWDEMRAAYEPLFVGAAGGAAGGRPAVDVVIGSHVHVYERAWQVAANGTYVVRDYAGMTTPFYVLSGSAGCIEGSTPFLGAPPAWSAARFGEDEAFGVVTLAFVNETHLREAFVDAHGGAERDSAWIVRRAA